MEVAGGSVTCSRLASIKKPFGSRKVYVLYDGNIDTGAHRNRLAQYIYFHNVSLVGEAILAAIKTERRVL